MGRTPDDLLRAVGRGAALAAGLLLCAVVGCGKPNAASIVVRKENQDLRDRVASLEKAREGDAATIKALEERVGTVPTLPKERLDRLFTAHGLNLGRLTGGLDTDSSKPGDEGIKVYAVPTDQEGQPLKAAGSFTIEAFDLASPQSPLVGKWTFDAEAAKSAWNGAAMSYQYVLKAPWQNGPPAHPELTVKTTFTDELTGRQFSAQKVVNVALSSQASSTAATTASSTK
jgi:hypothetical protein